MIEALFSHAVQNIDEFVSELGIWVGLFCEGFRVEFGVEHSGEAESHAVAGHLVGVAEKDDCGVFARNIGDASGISDAVSTVTPDGRAVDVTYEQAVSIGSFATVGEWGLGCHFGERVFTEQLAAKK